MTSPDTPPAVEFTTIDDQKSWRRAAVVCIIIALSTTFLAVGVMAYEIFRDEHPAECPAIDR
jgi:hypothetical protein